MEGIQQNLTWLKEKKIRSYETVLDGIEKAPEALIDLLRGAHKGRVVIRINTEANGAKG